MKRNAIILAALLAICGIALAQEAPQSASASHRSASAPHRSEAAVKALKQDITRAACNHNSYEFFPIKDTPAPKGYKPFYISHYGRHGSRSGWGGDRYTYVIHMLERGEKAGILTPGGDSLLAATRKEFALYAGMDGRLTPRGVREHAAIAERMYKRYPQVFKGQKKIRAVSSTVQRCIISMTAFTNSLMRLNPKLDIRPDTGERIMEYISPEGDWKEATEKAYAKAHEVLRSMPDDTLGVMEKLFTDPEAGLKLIPSPKRLTDCIFTVAEMAEDFDIEENLFRFLPFDAIYKRWARSNMSLYTGQCNSAESGLQRVPMAKLSVDDIVAKADEAIAGGEYAADLRFGHDYPLLGLVSYLGIEGVGERYTADEICDKWLAFWEIPMASNLQMIFYRNKKGDVLVKFLYQEQERLLRGLEPVQGPYYRWSDVKANLEGYLR